MISFGTFESIWYERVRRVAPYALLGAFLVAQAAYLPHSYYLALATGGILLVLVATELPMVPILTVLLLARSLTDDAASSASHISGAVNPSGAIAVIFILVAVGLLAVRQRGLFTVLIIVLGLVIWTGIAAASFGSTLVTYREAVRELSILAVGVIVYNSCPKIDMATIARIVQIGGLIAAILAFFQLLTHTGLDVAGQFRANGTFAHPNDAAVYFAIAASASVWRYFELNRDTPDALLAALFFTATLATYSLTGFASLLVMLAVYGILRNGLRRQVVRLVAALACLVAIFFATPLGSHRIASEAQSTGSIGLYQSSSTSSLQWRLFKWRTLLPEWEKAPIFGQGLGSTITAEARSSNQTIGNLAHSEYIRFLVEGGIIGFAAALLALVILYRRLRVQLAHGPTGAAARLGMAVLVGILIDAFAANTLVYTPAAYAASMILAAALIGYPNTSTPLASDASTSGSRRPVRGRMAH